MKDNKFIDNLSIILVLVFLFLPIGVLVLFSFNTSELNIVFEGFTTHWYKDLFQNKALLEALKNSLILAGVSTLVSTVIGTISAYALHRFEFPFKNTINELLYIPVVLPELVLGISLLCIYTLLKLELGMFTLILAHISFSMPYVIISVRSVLEGMDPNLEKAASDLGASKLKTFFYVIIPSLMPGIISGAELAFSLSIDDVVVSYFTAGPNSNTLPLHIYSILKTGVTPDVNALITIMLGIIFICLTTSMIFNLRKLKNEVRR